jgi:phage terminase large subunit-like protein
VARSPSAARSTSRAPDLVGCETPRIFTPPLRPLEPRSKATEKRTLGYECIDFAEQDLGVDLMPWQRWALIHMLELGPDGHLRFRTVVILVARQNGKSTLSVVLALFFMAVLCRKLVIGTAQDLDVAEEIWQHAVDLVIEIDDDEQPVRPELYALFDKIVGVNGKKSLNFTTGERYKVKAANRRAGRSLSGDLVMLDELREHQSWDAWGAVTKTTMARAHALILALSNAGDASSIVLRHLRTMAHLALGNPDGLEADPSTAPGARGEDDEDDLAEFEDEFDDDDPDDTLAIFEWSAAPGCSVRDRHGWRQANPALGHARGESMVTYGALKSAAATDPEWVFRTECLCQWNPGSTESPFPDESWNKTLDPASRRTPGSPLMACVDVSHDRTMAHIAVAGRREDGLVHVEVVASRPGTEWVQVWLSERVERLNIAGITGQAKGAPVSPLMKDLVEAGLPVTLWEGSNLAAWTGRFHDLVCKGGVKRRAQPALDVPAATAATKPMGETWVWNRAASPSDIAPLVAVTGAVGLLLDAPAPKPEPRIRFIQG